MSGRFPEAPRMTTVVEQSGGRLTLDVLRAFVASTGQVPGDARVVVRTSDDQRDGASFTLKVTFEGAPS